MTRADDIPPAEAMMMCPACESQMCTVTDLARVEAPVGGWSVICGTLPGTLYLLASCPCGAQWAQYFEAVNIKGVTR